MIHHTRVLINPRAYENNIRYFAALSPHSLCAVVKADAYGHGLRELAPVAVQAGAEYLGISDNWEAGEIRRLGLQCPILRLRPALRDECEEAQSWGVEELVGSLESAEMLSEIGKRSETPISIHVKIDAGMGRMSFSSPRQNQEIERICQLPGVRVKGLMTHFPCADEEDIELTKDQLKRFEELAHALTPILPKDVMWHTANSAATLRLPESHYSLTRVGIASYGLKPSPITPVPQDLHPVMSFQTRVAQLRELPKGSTIGYGMTYTSDRDMWLATLPVGYADGYLRDFSNRAYVLIQGVRCPVVGRITMNMIIVDVSGLPQVSIGDEAILMGRQGSEEISADELAQLANTINYEITCLFGKCSYQRVLDETC